MSQPGADAGWELQAGGWPEPNWPLTLLGGLLLTLTALVTFEGARMASPLMDLQIPPLLPLLVALGLLQAYRVAHWRSRAWRLQGADVVVTGGVFRPRELARVPSEQVTPRFFAGLTADSTAALIDACRTRSAPSQPPTSRGRARHVADVFLLGLILLAPAESLVWAQRRARDRFEAFRLEVESAADEAIAGVESSLITDYQSWASDRGLTAQRAACAVDPGGSSSYYGGLLSQLRFELRVRLDVTGPAGRRLDVVRLDVTGNQSAFGQPAALRITPYPDPASQRFLGALLARLDAAELTYRVLDPSR